MVTKTDAGPTAKGLVRIERQPGESRESFQASAQEATYELDGQKQVLQLDGRIDNVLLGRSFDGPHIEELRQLVPHLRDIRSACETSEGGLLGIPEATVVGRTYRAEVDGKGDGYLLRGDTCQELRVRLRGWEEMELCVSTRFPREKMVHTMTGILTDFEVRPTEESLSWNLSSDQTPGRIR